MAKGFLEKNNAARLTRAIHDGQCDGHQLPSYWSDLIELGWLGLHIPEAAGGSGYGLPELLVVVEHLGCVLAAGPFVTSAIAAATLAEHADERSAEALLSGLLGGQLTAGLALGQGLQVRGSSATGELSLVAFPRADVIAVNAGEDVVVIAASAPGCSLSNRPNLDPSRPSAPIAFDRAPCLVLSGAGHRLVRTARMILAAEAAGVARACSEAAAGYAKERRQFGRVIGTFQSVKHHCANMAVATQLAQAAVWDAGRAATQGGDVPSLAAATAVATAVPAAVANASLNTQVHGGIGFTWEHDAHLYSRRALAIAAMCSPVAAALDVVDLTRRGARVPRGVDLPTEAETYRAEARKVAVEAARLDPSDRHRFLVRVGYAVPHWPAPWGRGALAVEQLVIEEELAAAGVRRPYYDVTGWVILTIIQHGTADQVDRWVRPALDGDVTWCQLFSEPDAGSDAAGITTRATPAEGGWKVTGQKVWTSGAQAAAYGLATVRSDPAAPKHAGISVMAIDMAAPGVEISPLRLPNGDEHFSEVFLDDVYVSDTDVVGPVNDGWRVARATLGNESVSLGGGGQGTYPGEVFIAPLDSNPERLEGGGARIGRYISMVRATDALNLRRAQRAVVGDEPDISSAVTKLQQSLNLEEAAQIATALAGPESAYTDSLAQQLGIMFRGMTIAGGTSEIKRNQIAERLLGLPRDPLVD